MPQGFGSLFSSLICLKKQVIHLRYAVSFILLYLLHDEVAICLLCNPLRDTSKCLSVICLCTSLHVFRTIACNDLLERNIHNLVSMHLMSLEFRSIDIFNQIMRLFYVLCCMILGVHGITDL